VLMMLAALALGSAGLLLEPARSTHQEILPHYFNTFEGALDSVVALFLIGATLFLLWFPVRVPRNVVMVMAGVVVYMVSHWAMLLLLNLYPRAIHQVFTVPLGIYLLCLIFWIFSVQRSGESVTTVTGHRWKPEETERLLGQLDTINARLQQLAR